MRERNVKQDMRTVLYNARIIPGPGFDGAIQHGYVIVEGENIVRIGGGGSGWGIGGDKNQFAGEDRSSGFHQYP
ncbi:hypothetical protein CULT_60011 [[Clostridium] ultunense Esp]|nr:hypothetical protein CULT_60011 [[Clostridium] ultunense Esp]